MIVLLAIICLLYAPMLIWLLIGASKVPTTKDSFKTPHTAFSILIPFRNEAHNLPLLLRSIQLLDYPSILMEVILIDDESSDDSIDVIRQFESEASELLNLKLRVIQNKRKSNSPKKDAIAAGIAESLFDWIICTDADCQLPPMWLRLYDQCIQQKRPKMVCAPVVCSNGTSLLATYQLLDGLSLQMVTMAGFGWKRPMLCNGANIGYLKEEFIRLNGYEGNDHIASGDDVFLLEKFRKRNSADIVFLKNNKAAVNTQPEDSWKGVIRQRVRWAGKTSQQSIFESKLIGGVVFLGNLAFLAAIVWVVTDPNVWAPFLVLLVIKLGLDYLVLWQAGNILKKTFGITSYLLNVIIYPIVTIWVVLRSLGRKYEWKSRTFKK